MRRFWITVLLGCASLQGSAIAEPALEAFFAKNCIECHGSEKQKGKVRLDGSIDDLFANADLSETVVSVLEAGEMPPEDAPQPKAEARAQKRNVKNGCCAMGTPLRSRCLLTNKRLARKTSVLKSGLKVVVHSDYEWQVGTKSSSHSTNEICEGLAILRRPGQCLFPTGQYFSGVFRVAIPIPRVPTT